MCDFSEYGGKSDEWLKLENSLPAPPNDLTLEELKRVTNDSRLASVREEMKILSPKVSIQDFTVPTRDDSTIEVRTYRPASADASTKLPIYIHLHGGGFFFGSIGTEDSTCSLLAIDTGVVVVDVNYRHLPDFVYPTAWNDSEDAFAWIYDHAEDFGGDNMQIIVGGVTAGAYLAASLILKLRRDEDERSMGVVGQILMAPAVLNQDSQAAYLNQLKDPSISSYKENEFAPLLPVSQIEFLKGMLFPERPDLEDRRANPGLATAEEVRTLPPTTFGVCGLDPLRDEALIYAKLLQENGVPVSTNVFKGVPNAFRNFGDKLPKAMSAWDQVMHGAIRWSLGKPVPSPDKFDVHVFQT